MIRVGVVPGDPQRLWARDIEAGPASARRLATVQSERPNFRSHGLNAGSLTPGRGSTTRGYEQRGWQRLRAVAIHGLRRRLGPDGMHAHYPLSGSGALVARETPPWRESFASRAY